MKYLKNKWLWACLVAIIVVLWYYGVISPDMFADPVAEAEAPAS